MFQTLDQYLSADNVHPLFEAASKKRLLENIATTISGENATWAEQLTDSLMARERLGSTGVGQGIAVPHCRSKKLESPEVHLFALREPVDFDSLDGQPVDFVCVLLVPEQSNELHLQLLRDVIATFADPQARAPLLAAEDAQSLYETCIRLFKDATE